MECSTIVYPSHYGTYANYLDALRQRGLSPVELAHECVSNSAGRSEALMNTLSAATVYPELAYCVPHLLARNDQAIHPVMPYSAAPQQEFVVNTASSASTVLHVSDAPSSPSYHYPFNRHPFNQFPLNHAPFEHALSSQAPLPLYSSPQTCLYIIEQDPYVPKRGGRLCKNPGNIKFTVHGRPGVRLVDLLNDRSTKLDEANERPLKSTGRKVMYRFQLKGYPPFSRPFNIMHDSKPLWKSKGEIAVQVARTMRYFMIRHNLLDFGLWTRQGIVPFSELALLELHQVTTASWQPVIAQQG